MSISKRLYDLARSNLNALLDKAAEAADARSHLGDFTDVELAEELERREVSQVRKDGAAGAKDQIDTEARSDRNARERIAHERAERVRKQKQQRQDQARARPRPQPRPPPGANNNARPGPKASPGSKRARVRTGRDEAMAKHYAVLEVPPGSSFADVKLAYRRLIRKYHPDLHRNNPAKLKAASEVSIALTTAYNELETALVGGPNR